MAVESIGVTEQVDGVNVACMEATENDTNKTEIRVIQQIDLVHAKKIGMDTASYERTVTAADTGIVASPLGAPHSGLVVTVGDNSLIEVNCIFKAAENQSLSYLSVTPIILNASNVPLGVLPTKATSGIIPTGSDGEVIHFVDTNKFTLCHPLTWWVGQYERISFVFGLNNTSDEARVWAKCHNGFPNDAFDMFTVNAANTVGGTGGPAAVMATSGSANTAGG